MVPVLNVHWLDPHCSCIQYSDARKLLSIENLTNLCVIEYQLSCFKHSKTGQIFQFLNSRRPVLGCSVTAQNVHSKT
jgi:hypothetical protein